MTKQIICSSCGESKPHCAKGLCATCYQNKLTGTTFTERMRTIETCKILTKHANEHCNDDDKLTTDFIVGEIEKLRESKK